MYSQLRKHSGWLGLALVLSGDGLFAADPQEEAAAPFPGRQSVWHGFNRYDFQISGSGCIVVTPKKAAEGNPWVWRARFFGHEPQADVALLGQGYHIAYCEVGGLFGSPEAVERWDAFHAYLVAQHGFAEKVALEGMSRGGLIIYNWAARNPEKVACLYGDAPVCDIRSWPGGKGTGKGSPADWTRAMAQYGLTEETAATFRGGPIDNLEPLARWHVPILHVVGDADDVVPIAENSDLVEKRYRALGGSIEVIHKPGVGHHPHSLTNPAPIVEFITRHTGAAQPGTKTANYFPRGDLLNSQARFLSEKQGRVAFIGGSITEMEGYRPMVSRMLQERFPQTKFTLRNAGIASTCSTTGAFRLPSDVLDDGPVDLLFIEFAVNDDGDAHHARRECIRGMEGIIRQARRHNPRMDIVLTYFVNEGMLQALQHGRIPVAIGSHDEVARYYGVSTIHLAREVASRISEGELTWKAYGGTHPAPLGNRICADMIGRLLADAWPARPADAPAAHPMPVRPLDPLCYQNGRFIDPAQSTDRTGWTLGVPDWKSIPGNNRSRFAHIPLLCATEPGANLTLKVEGTTVGAYVLAGPDAGMAEVSIDGGEVSKVDLFHHFSKGLHYPRTVILGTDLAPGAHTLTLRLSGETHGRGTAIRILQFAVN